MLRISSALPLLLIAVFCLPKHLMASLLLQLLPHPLLSLLSWVLGRRLLCHVLQAANEQGSLESDLVGALHCQPTLSALHAAMEQQLLSQPAVLTMSQNPSCVFGGFQM